MESIPNKWCVVTRKVGQGHTASRSAQDRDLSLSVLRHKWTTAPQLARDLAAVFGRRISRQPVYSRLAETGLYTR
ncbi:hypothetical protein TNCV_4739741 [Trichonephila clavipes]|nr:hypothetical protein TNCV_4739741 [Trichonephila clavipes]